MVKLAIDPFALRDFGPPGQNTKLYVAPDEFLKHVEAQSCPLVDGYAPFCKHLIIPNPYHVLPGYLTITDSLRPLIKTGYVKRRPEELAVLSRWIETESIPTELVTYAKYIDVILYSREQICKETEAMGGQAKSVPQVDWLIISLKFQDEPAETPMQPITCMRNALISEGGSGVSIDKAAYEASVQFWDQHVELR